LERINNQYFLKLIFGLEHNKRIFFGNIENEKNEGLSQIPNELRYFCMDLIKEQLSKH